MEARWLGAEEQEAWLQLLSVTMWLPAALDVQLQRDSGLSHYEYAVLAQLSMSPDRTRRMSELAREANGTLPRLSKVVDRLARQGWVTRRPDPDDGRYTLATLTEAGWRKVVETAPGHVDQVRRVVFDQLSASQGRQLRAIAGKSADAARNLSGRCP